MVLGTESLERRDTSGAVDFGEQGHIAIYGVLDPLNASMLILGQPRQIQKHASFYRIR
jgi:hypothetical protein